MNPPALVGRAVEALYARFERGDYNPTPIVDLGALVANADGTIDDKEIEALAQILEPLLGARVNPELVGYLIEASVAVIRAAGAPARVRVIAEILLDCGAVEEGITVALAVACASDGLSTPEQELIASLARASHLPEERLSALQAEVEQAYQA